MEAPLVNDANRNPSEASSTSTRHPLELKAGVVNIVIIWQLTWISTKPCDPVISGQHWTRVPSPSLKRSLRSLVKNVGDVDVLTANISPLSLSILTLLVLLLVLILFSSAFSLPGCGRHGLDGVRGQRPHVAHSVQEVCPGGQTNRDLRASRLKTLNIKIKIGEKSIHSGSLSQDPIWIKSLKYLWNST